MLPRQAVPLWQLTLLTLVYFVAGKLGLLLAFVHASATAVWPPTGIALTAFLLLGSRVWPAILLGAFLVNVTTEGSVLTSIAAPSVPGHRSDDDDPAGCRRGPTETQ